MMQPKGATARGGAVERSETEGEYLMALLLRAIPLSSRLAPRHFPRKRGQLLGGGCTNQKERSCKVQ